MSIGESFLPEFDQEMAGTRRVLERVPTQNGEWKPHPKSFSMGHLAQLVAGMPGWIANALREPSLDLAKGDGYSYQPTEKLVAMFDAKVQAAREALAAAADPIWQELWTLKRGDMVLWTAPRVVIVRSHINHLVHHRAQLGVYLRLNDIPVPSLYGPTADERM